MWTWMEGFFLHNIRDENSSNIRRWARTYPSVMNECLWVRYSIVNTHQHLDNTQSQHTHTQTERDDLSQMMQKQLGVDNAAGRCPCGHIMWLQCVWMDAHHTFTHSVRLIGRTSFCRPHTVSNVDAAIRLSIQYRGLGRFPNVLLNTNTSASIHIGRFCSDSVRLILCWLVNCGWRDSVWHLDREVRTNTYSIVVWQTYTYL